MKLTTNFKAVFVLFFLNNLAFGQIMYQQLGPNSGPTNTFDFESVHYSSISSQDIDGDGDEDILICGKNLSNQPSTKLYENDGLGNFTMVSSTPFENVLQGSVLFSDIDGDNDQDIILTGENGSFQLVTKIYSNDGNGNFVEVLTSSLEGVKNSFIATSDIDNDNDEDLLITGENSSGIRISKLYLNDANGVFTEITGTPFDGVRYGSVAFSDIDNDNDNDLLITGFNNANTRIAKLYKNDGSGNFIYSTGTPFIGVYSSSIGFADFDNDNDNDLLITGYKLNASNVNEPVTNLYLNDGLGNFSEQLTTPFVDLSLSSIQLNDVDNDNDIDIFISGQDVNGFKLSKLYLNDGFSNFTDYSTPFEGFYTGSSQLVDVENDGDYDILITGINDLNQTIIRLYINQGLGVFEEATSITYSGVENSSTLFFDADNDNDMDFLVSGLNSLNQKNTELYVNDGFGGYTINVSSTFENVDNGSMDFADVDGDSDQDVLITGFNNSGQRISKLYLNDGNGLFTESTNSIFEGVRYSSVTFEDIDLDGDKDVLITGENSGNLRTAKLYENNGLGLFTEISGTSFDGVRYGTGNFGDVDGDGHQDLLITGFNNSDERISKMYVNDGLGGFSIVLSTPFDGVYSSSVDFADINGDSDLDIVISGLKLNVSNTNEPVTKLYENDGSGNFTEVVSTPFESIALGSLSFNDIDNDNDQDLVISGRNNLNEKSTRLYTNNGIGLFTEVNGLPLEGVFIGSLSLADIDNDNDIDILLTGRNNNNDKVTELYKNVTTCAPNESIDIQSSCNSFTWINGNTYTGSNNTATHTLTNIGGCDSIVYLDLTINYSNTGTDVQTACESYDWIDGNTYTTSNNTATHTLTNAAGCDSVVTLDLTINYSNTGTDVQTACNSYDWIDGNTYTSSNNTATHTLINAAGCDSVVTLDLTMNTVDVLVNYSGNGTLVASSILATSYQWIDCDNANAEITEATDILYTPTANGDYAVVVSDGTCSDTSACFNINDVSLSEEFTSTSFVVFPNPTKNNFQITTDLPIENIQIFSTTGELILETTQKEISLANTSKGIYIIKLLSEGNVYTQRIVKN